jgi:hypothetical protein
MWFRWAWRRPSVISVPAAALDLGAIETRQIPRGDEIE